MLFHFRSILYLYGIAVYHVHTQIALLKLPHTWPVHANTSYIISAIIATNAGPHVRAPAIYFTFLLFDDPPPSSNIFFSFISKRFIPAIFILYIFIAIAM